MFAGLIWSDSAPVLLTAALASLLPALASYRWVEQPLRRIGAIGARRTSLLVAVVIVPPLALSAVLAAAATYIWPTMTSSLSADAQRMHAGYIEGCHWESEYGNSDPQPCEWNSSSAGDPVYLLGDSNAAHYVEGLIDATTRLQRPLIVTTSSACPLITLSLVTSGSPGYDEACRQRTERLLSWMERQDPGSVVLSNSDEYWLSPDYVVVSDDSSTSDEATKVSLMGDALERTVYRLQSAGHQVNLIQTVPHFADANEWVPANCTLAASLQGCPQVMPLADATSRSSRVKDMVAEVGNTTGARVYDLSSIICPDGNCRTARDGKPIYRDATHISVAMSHELGSDFIDVLNSGQKSLLNRAARYPSDRNALPPR